MHAGENYANPQICFFHVLFKAAALAFYILPALFVDSFVIIFVVTVLLAALDFWVVKNVSGRILIGLRWWNEIMDEGESDQDQDHDFWVENSEWNDWQTTVFQERNIVENVYRWACGRTTALQDRTRDSDEDDLHDRDFDVAALANNLSQAFTYSIYDNEDAEEGNGALDRVDEVPYITTALMDAKLGTEGHKDLFDWLSRQLSGLSNFPDAVNLNY
ncbi:unnamed protein product [Camellia sinensis]